MFKRILIKLLLKWYINKELEVKKLLSSGEEFNGLLFNDPFATRNYLKALMTANMKSYFDAKNDEERYILKGGALSTRALLDNHLKAYSILEANGGEAENSEQWAKAKGKR
jgi:hypothetical protein